MTTRRPTNDTPRRWTGALLVLLAFLLANAAPARTQQLPGSDAVTPDSVVERLGLPEDHTPSKALRRALMVPGWGQYYNRQYWKVPIAVAGLGGVIFGVIYSWDRYFLYRNAWRYRRTRGGGPDGFIPLPAEGEADPYDGPFGDEEYREARNTVREMIDTPEAQNLNAVVRDRRDRFRRWSELSILGIGVFWLLQVSDAYVSAHLLGFEIGDVEPARRASVSVAPTQMGPAARLRVRF